MTTPMQLNNTPWVQVNEFARQKVHDLGPQRIRLLELKPGFEETQWCHKGHVGYVIQGSLEVEYEEDCTRYVAGDVLVLSEGRPHKAKTLDDQVTIFLVDQ